MSRFLFLSGLPRTGSTVLISLLSQNTLFYPTSTSVVRDIMNIPYTYCLGESLYYNSKDINSPLWNIMGSILYGSYKHVDENKIIIEKDRGWSKDISKLSIILKEPPKIIATIRPVEEIISSFLLLAKKIGKNNKIDDEVKLTGRDLNDWNRSRIIWEKYIYQDWKFFKSGYEYDPSCFLLVDYNEIISNPQKIINDICKYSHINSFEVDTKNIYNPNQENDCIYGLPGLHKIRSNLERTSSSAKDILGEKLYNYWNEKQLNFWINK